MGREWMVPKKDQKRYYEVEVWVRDGIDKELYSEWYEIVCYPDDLEEKVEHFALQDFGEDRATVEDWQIRSQSALKMYDEV